MFVGDGTFLWGEEESGGLSVPQVGFLYGVAGSIAGCYLRKLKENLSRLVLGLPSHHVRALVLKLSGEEPVDEFMEERAEKVRFNHLVEVVEPSPHVRCGIRMNKCMAHPTCDEPPPIPQPRFMRQQMEWEDKMPFMMVTQSGKFEELKWEMPAPGPSILRPYVTPQIDISRIGEDICGEGLRRCFPNLRTRRANTNNSRVGSPPPNCGDLAVDVEYIWCLKGKHPRDPPEAPLGGGLDPNNPSL